MNDLLNIGYGNFVSRKRIVAIIAPGSAPIKRLRETAREEGRLIDLTQGRKTRCVLLTDTNHLVLSGVMSDTVAQRYENQDEPIINDGINGIEPSLEEPPHTGSLLK